MGCGGVLNKCKKQRVEFRYETNLFRIFRAPPGGHGRGSGGSNDLDGAAGAQRPGFYYGDVDGKKSADTTAAIRRYQIRNGLQITGEIDAEMLRSLGIGAGAARSTPKPRAAPTQDDADLRDDGAPTQSAEISPQRPPPNYNPQHAPGGVYAPGPRGLQPEVSGVFDGTPYEIAPPDLQRHVIVGAQTLLTRSGYYRSGIDGEFGPGTEAAVRAFQNRVGIAPDGRLNMETLAALGLLPGQHAPGFPLRPGGFCAGRFTAANGCRSTHIVRREAGSVTTSRRQIGLIEARRKPSRQKRSLQSEAKAGRHRRKSRRWRAGIFCAARARAFCRSCSAEGRA